MQVLSAHTAPSTALEVHRPPVLSIVVPTFNEAANLPELFERLLAFVRETKLSIETIVVDDASPDGTGVLAEELAIRNNGTLSARVLHRPGKLGLSSALLDGMRASRAPWVAILDADHSHDVRQLADMFRVAQVTHADVVIGSRYAPGGAIEDWPASRRIISLSATFLARSLLRLPVHDPVSGFAVFRREVIERLPDLRNPQGYKLLLEILVRLRPLSVMEVPITFRNRRNGESKLSGKEIVEFGRLILALLRERHASSLADARHEWPRPG